MKNTNEYKPKLNLSESIKKKTQYVKTSNKTSSNSLNNSLNYDICLSYKDSNEFNDKCIKSESLDLNI